MIPNSDVFSLHVQNGVKTMGFFFFAQVLQTTYKQFRAAKSPCTKFCSDK